jgi:hypothetical protein
MSLRYIDSLVSYSKQDRQAELNKLAPAVKTTLSDFAKVSKALSKLIAKSWLKNPDGTYTHPEIRNALLSSSSEQLQAYLNEYLKKLNLPPLDAFTVKISVTNWNSFYGQITESPTGGSVYILPYPPQPSFVTNNELQAWINNNDDNDITPVDAGIHYVPLTFC